MKSLILSGLSVVVVSGVAISVIQAKGFASSPSMLDRTLSSQTIAQALSSGSFVSGEHPTQGTVSIIQENGQRYIELGSDFSTDAGPDLFVILHRSSDVIGTTTSPAHSIQEGDYATIAPLQQVSGTQRYAIPASLDLSSYQSVAIWCRQFNATFGAASLSN